MAAKKPTMAQAELQLKLYDLRREARLRQARDWVLMHYFLATFQEALSLAPAGSQENALLRHQVEQSHGPQALEAVLGTVHHPRQQEQP